MTLALLFGIVRKKSTISELCLIQFLEQSLRLAGKYHYQRSEVEETVSKWVVTGFFTQRQKPLEAGMCDRNSNSFLSVPRLFLIREKREKKKKTIKINLASTSFWQGKKKKKQEKVLLSLFSLEGKLLHFSTGTQK